MTDMLVRANSMLLFAIKEGVFFFEGFNTGFYVLSDYKVAIDCLLGTVAVQ